MTAPALTAQTAPTEPFSFERLTEAARTAAAKGYQAPERFEDIFGGLTYDDYRLIRFRPDRALWSDTDQPWRLHPFHMGWLFAEPVALYEVREGTAVPVSFTTRDFEYLNELEERVPENGALPGIAGFRLNAPLNRPEAHDEVVAFLGASYFRALGQNSQYGLSARGLALNTASSNPEEFPRFSEFYIERDPNGAERITVYARLDGPSVAGAYRFVIRPGKTTEMDVTTRLFFREDVTQLGIAPLTSMYLFSGLNSADFDDYRPRVHDSEGLHIVQSDGDTLWRPLNNPERLAGSFLEQTNPVSFGLHQRARAFENYDDLGAHYERRPSLDVVPKGDWGRGTIRLVEIPTDTEVNDNIVAFFIPDGEISAGDEREFSYQLRWGDLPIEPDAELAHVCETRAGVGGVSGVENAGDERKFVIDFKGGMLGALTEDDAEALKPVVTVGNGELVYATIEKIEATDIWRLVVDVRKGSKSFVELSAHIAGYNRKLTEIWLYQWILTDA